MTVSRVRSCLVATACAAFFLAPALAPGHALAQAPGGGDATGGRNLTQEVQRAGPIALPSLAPLADHVLPAVVNISVELNQQAAMQYEGDSADSGNGDSGGVSGAPGATPFDQFMRRFFDHPSAPRSPGEKIMALGSGFIIDPRGYVVTNNHVVANAEKVTVVFQDHTLHPAKVLGRDQKTDLALLKIQSDKQLPYVTWGNSDAVKVGDWVVAVGNPFGLGGTVTAGIVSALGRNINEGPYDDFLQIDAPINRGNSGGPTFDLSGQVVGINTAIYSPSGGSVGIGFAIPSNLARHVVDELKAHGKVTWGWLGVSIQGITPAIAKSLGLGPSQLVGQPAGALVASVTPDSPAAKAGLKAGDVIVAAGGRDIKNVHDLPRVVAETPVGTELELKVRRDGKERTMTADIGEMPAKTEAVAEGGTAQPGAAAAALGMELAPLGPQLRSELAIGKDVSGVVVLRVARDSPVSALGVKPGDVIVSIDQQPATTPQQAAAALKEAAKNGNILLLINRAGTSEFVGLSVGNKGMSGSSSP